MKFLFNRISLFILGLGATAFIVAQTPAFQSFTPTIIEAGDILPVTATGINVTFNNNHQVYFGPFYPTGSTQTLIGLQQATNETPVAGSTGRKIDFNVPATVTPGAYYILCEDTTQTLPRTRIASAAPLTVTISPDSGIVGGFIYTTAKTDGGVANLPLILKKENGVQVGTTVTDINGHFEFRRLKVGYYFLYVDQPTFNNANPPKIGVSSINRKMDSLQIKLSNNQLVGVATEVYKIGAYKVFPNPTTGKFTVLFENPTFTSVQVTIMDFMGRRISSEKMIPDAEKTFSFDLSEHAPGIYSIELNANGQVKKFKVVKQQ